MCKQDTYNFHGMTQIVQAILDEHHRDCLLRKPQNKQFGGNCQTQSTMKTSLDLLSLIDRNL